MTIISINNHYNETNCLYLINRSKYLFHIFQQILQFSRTSRKAYLTLAPDQGNHDRCPPRMAQLTSL
jgi:hypothetical protein